MFLTLKYFWNSLVVAQRSGGQHALDQGVPFLEKCELWTRMSFDITSSIHQFVSPVLWSRSNRQGEPRRSAEPTRRNEDGIVARPLLLSRPIHSLLTPSRGNCRTFEGVEFLSPTLVTCGASFSTQASLTPEQLKALEDSSVRACSHAVWAAADSGSRSRSSLERAWADAKTAVGGGGSFGNEAYQLSSDLLREGASAGFAQVTPVRCHKRGTKTPSFRSKKLIFCELERPFETPPKMTCESTSANSRLPHTRSRVNHLEEADQAL